MNIPHKPMLFNTSILISYFVLGSVSKEDLRQPSAGFGRRRNFPATRSFFPFQTLWI